MTTSIRALALLLCVGFSALPATSVAKKRQKYSKKSRAQAGRHFDNGVSLYDRGKFSEALAEFERAYDLAPHPQVLYNIAATHRELSHYGKSIETFRIFLKKGKSKVPKSRIRQARSELREILDLVANVVVKSDVKGTKISVDGRNFGKTPLESPILVGPGEHVISGKVRRQSDEQTFRVASGDTTVIELVMSDPPEATLKPSESSLTALPDASSEAAVSKDEILGTSLASAKSYKRGYVSAVFAFTVDRFGKTGSPGVGLGYEVFPRVILGIDALIVDFSVIPSVRVRLLGDQTSLRAIAALPITFDESQKMVAFGGVGLGVHRRVSSRLALKLEAMASFNDTIVYPVFASAELGF